MIMPSITDGASAGEQALEEPAMKAPAAALAELGTASMALAMFLDRPATGMARAAIAALEQWDGPLAARPMEALLRLVPARRRSAAAAALLKQYLAEHAAEGKEEE